MKLTETLARCAYLRNVAMVPHRTLHEFDWFVQSVIFGGKYPEEEALKEKYNSRRPTYDLDSQTQFERWGELFLEYCEEEYGED